MLNRDLNMYIRSWLAVVIGLTVIPAVRAQSDIPNRVSDAAYLVAKAGPSTASFVDEYLNSSATRDSDFDTISPIATAESLGWNLRNCRWDNCSSVRIASNAVSGARLQAMLAAGQRSESQAAKADENSFAALDIGLMVIFGFGLLAYPLILKQKALQHSSVLASQHPHARSLSVLTEARGTTGAILTGRRAA
jgi:hypothetical protein